MTEWRAVTRGSAPLIVGVPHTGMRIPGEVVGLRNRADALHDVDYFIDRLYKFAASIGATIIRTDISRTVVDVNRDPSGGSLHLGQATTGL